MKTGHKRAKGADRVTMHGLTPVLDAADRDRAGMAVTALKAARAMGILGARDAAILRLSATVNQAFAQINRAIQEVVNAR